MSKIKRITVALASDADGDQTQDTIPVRGKVTQIRYVVDGVSPLATGADLTITGRDTGINVLTKVNIGTSSFTVCPRQATHGAEDGAAALYAATFPVEDYVWVDEPLTILLDEGGASKVGTLHIWLEE